VRRRRSQAMTWPWQVVFIHCCAVYNTIKTGPQPSYSSQDSIFSAALRTNVLDKRVDQTSELTKNLNYLNKNRHKTTTNYLIN
jgi:hypothetical protein